MVRSGVWLEQAVVPYVPVEPEGSAPLNAYLYDFFRHGNVDALEKGNMVRKGDIWFVLNDFSLVLATIVTSLENFLRLSPSTDDDMLDVMGGGDAHEGDLDDVAAAVGDSNPRKGPDARHLRSTPVQAASVSPLSKKLAKVKIAVADSWEDEICDSDGSSVSESADWDQQYGDRTREQGNGSTPVSDSMLDGQGILLVLEAFKMLQAEFNDKFKAMWA